MADPISRILPTAPTSPTTPPPLTEIDKPAVPKAVNRNTQDVWETWDPESVRNTAGGISHAASALQNLRAMGEDIGHAALPDRMIELTFAGAKTGGAIGAFVGLLKGIVMDALEALLLAFMLLKNLLDLIGHGGAAAVNATNNELDGVADPQHDPDFYWLDNSSFARQFGSGEDRKRLNALTSPVNTGLSLGRFR